MSKSQESRAWEREAPDEADERAVELALQEVRDDVTAVREQMACAIVGQERVIEELLIAALAGGHVLIEGVPGLGKTLIVRTLAQVLDLRFSRVQCTPDLIPADVTGTNVLFESEAGEHQLRFQPGPIFAQLVLADEINRATPKAQSAFLEAMQEQQVTILGESHALPDPFIVLATQNPIEMEGTFPLPEAQLDRFLFKVVVEFPGRDELTQIARATTGPCAASPAPILGPGRLVAMRQLARRIPISSELLSAAVDLVRATHPRSGTRGSAVERFVRFGASPRGLQAIVLAGKVRALLRGRCHVASSDLAVVVAPALRHRLVMRFEAVAEGITPDELIARLAKRAFA